jgi:hypothetical protein
VVDSAGEFEEGDDRASAVGFDDRERMFLLAETTWLPELRALVMRAQRDADVPELWFVEATGQDLSEVRRMVEALAQGQRIRQLRALLDGLHRSLSWAIDGF